MFSGVDDCFTFANLVVKHADWCFYSLHIRASSVRINYYIFRRKLKSWGANESKENQLFLPIYQAMELHNNSKDKKEKGKQITNRKKMILSF